MTRRFRLLGITIESDVPLDPSLFVIGEAPPDLHVVTGEDRTTPSTPPRGDVIALLTVGERVLYVGTPDLLRFPGQCEVAITTDALVVHRDPEAEVDLVPLLLPGTILSFALALRGIVTLHASAVAVEGGAIAIVGPSGGGKTTVASLAARAGAAVVADDTVRIDVDGDDISCRPGSAVLRLRPSAAELAGSDADVTVDGRSLLRPTASSGDVIPLSMVVLPRPVRDHRRVTVTRLAPADALVQLAAHPRVAGWSERNGRRRHLATMAAVARTVPVLELHVPWGPPFPQSLGLEILECLAGASSLAR